MPKTVPESKFVELKGLDRISLMVHEMKYLWREINKDDVGIDGEIEVLRPKSEGKGYEVTGGIIKVQAKSGTSYIKEDKSNSFSVPSTIDDFKTWYDASFPTIFIVYHPKDDKLYYKEMRSYLRNTKDVWQAPIKIRINKASDLFGPASKSSLQKFSDVSPSRVSYTQKEKVFSNLLKVHKVPRRIWSAPCKMNTRQEVYEAIDATTPPFIVVGKRLCTFSDLTNKNCIFSKCYDISDVSSDSSDHFCAVEEGERNYVYLLNQLLGMQLKRKGIRYNKDFRRNFFPREDYKALEFKKRWYNLRTKTTAERTTAKYYEYASRKFWRHLAANFKFRRIGEAWFLQIIPQYLFTYDGNEPCDPDMVGPYTTRIKADESNQNVLNHVLFWGKAITGLQGKSETSKIWLEHPEKQKDKPSIVISRIPSTGVTDFAIPYDPATFDEPERPYIQTNLFALFNQLNEDGERIKGTESSSEEGDED